MNRSIESVANELFAIYGLEPIRAPQYVEIRPARVNEAALTADELRWMAEAQLATEGEDE